MTLNVANPLGYVYICPPVPYQCHDAYTGAGSGTNFDTVWIYSESIMNHRYDRNGRQQCYYQ